MTFLYSILLGTISAIVNGYVLSVLWKWFMVSQFNLPTIEIPTAIGISIIAGFLTHEFPLLMEKDLLLIQLAIAIVKPLTTLLAGYIAYSYI